MRKMVRMRMRTSRQRLRQQKKEAGQGDQAAKLWLDRDLEISGAGRTQTDWRDLIKDTMQPLHDMTLKFMADATGPEIQDKFVAEVQFAKVRAQASKNTVGRAAGWVGLGGRQGAADGVGRRGWIGLPRAGRRGFDECWKLGRRGFFG